MEIIKRGHPKMREAGKIMIKICIATGIIFVLFSVIIFVFVLKKVFVNKNVSYSDCSRLAATIGFGLASLYFSIQASIRNKKSDSRNRSENTKLVMEKYSKIYSDKIYVETISYISSYISKLNDIDFDGYNGNDCEFQNKIYKLNEITAGLTEEDINHMSSYDFVYNISGLIGDFEYISYLFLNDNIEENVYYYTMYRTIKLVYEFTLYLDCLGIISNDDKYIRAGIMKCMVMHKEDKNDLHKYR